MADSYEFITKNASETEALGARVVKGRPGIYCLYGQLGSGKTTFTRGIAKGIGYSSRLLSPTFIIVRRYILPSQKLLYHIDLYRLKNENEMAILGLQEIFQNTNAYIVIEWPERLRSMLPKKRTDIFFETGDNDIRTITIR